MCTHDCYKEGHQLLYCATPGSGHSLQPPHCPVNALWRRFFTLQNRVGLSWASARHCHSLLCLTAPLSWEHLLSLH